MPLTGQAKRDYQREYMRDYMRRKRVEGLNNPSESERIAEVELDADGNPMPEY